MSRFDTLIVMLIFLHIILGLASIIGIGIAVLQKISRTNFKTTLSMAKAFSISTAVSGIILIVNGAPLTKTCLILGVYMLMAFIAIIALEKLPAHT